MNKRISIHLCTKDRHSETGLLLQSLRTQTFQDWDLIILDDASGTPIQNCEFFMKLLNRIKLENHRVKFLRNDVSLGVCHARQKCIDEDDMDNEYSCRLDDDVIIDPKYLERLYDVCEKQGYDIASGVTPNIEQSSFRRNIKYVGPIINKHAFDKEGNLVQQEDDCGFTYLEPGDILETHHTKPYTIPTHQFRSCALFKNKVFEKVNYPTHLTTVGFREEGWISIRAILEGYTIGVDTRAIALHLRTSSGGVRLAPDAYNECVKTDDKTFREWMKQKFKQHGDFLTEYEKKTTTS